MEFACIKKLIGPVFLLYMWTIHFCTLVLWYLAPDWHKYRKNFLYFTTNQETAFQNIPPFSPARIFLLIGILIFLLLRSPCKKFKPWDNPFWGFEQRYQEQEIKKRKKINYLKKIPLAPMGVLAPGSAHASPSARPPIDTSGNFPAHVSPSNNSPNPSEVISEVSKP